MKLLPHWLYHGTAEDYERPKVSGDGLFWTCDRATFAQHYIPEAVGRAHTSYLFASDMASPVAPHQNDPYYAVVRMMGFQAQDIKFDRAGNATGFAAPAGYPTYAEVVHYIETVLGYQSSNPSPKHYEFKTLGWDSQERMEKIAPAGYCAPGNLLVLSGHQGMKMFDMTGDSDGGRQRQKRSRSLAMLEQQGFAGVIVNDFCHSKTLGTVAHRSYGFFADAVKELSLTSLPARHYEWPASPGAAASVLETPESAAWKAAQDARASVATAGRTLSTEQLRCRALSLHT